MAARIVGEGGFLVTPARCVADNTEVLSRGLSPRDSALDMSPACISFKG